MAISAVAWKATRGDADAAAEPPAPAIRPMIDNEATGDTPMPKAKVTRVKLPPEAKAPGRNKYGAKKVRLDGHVFDSRKEAGVYQKLRMLEAAGEITQLRVQARYCLVVNGYEVATYIPDFIYLDRDGQIHVVDAKSPATRKNRVYVLKKKLMKALLHIDIEEV